MNRDLHPTIADSLEHWIDRHSFAEVLQQLQQLASARAHDLRRVRPNDRLSYMALTDRLRMAQQYAQQKGV